MIPTEQDRQTPVGKLVGGGFEDRSVPGGDFAEVSVAVHRTTLRVRRTGEITGVVNVTAEAPQRVIEPCHAEGLRSEPTADPGGADVGGGTDETDVVHRLAFRGVVQHDATMTTPVPQTGSGMVAWLRGVNVGGNQRVPMAELRALAAGLGWKRVSTHLNSGNLLFRADAGATELASGLGAAITERFGLAVAVVVRSAAELEAVLAANPYPDGDPSQVCVAFVDGTMSAEQLEWLEGLRAPDERIAVVSPELVVDFGAGLARSVLAAKLPVVLRPAVITVRNLRTVTAVAAKLNALASG